MLTCSKCGEETREGKFCSNCGEPLDSDLNNENTELDKPLQDMQNKDNDTTAQNEIVTSNNQIQTQNNQPEYNQQNYNQQNYNQGYNNYQQNPNIPLNKKSKAVGLILNILLVGLGYAYVGKWGEGMVLLVAYLLMWFLGFILIIPWIIAFGLWIYSLVKTNEMIDKYNQGLPY